MNFDIKNEKEMLRIGEKIGQILCGGETIELSGDVGSGKTTLTKGIARGLKINEYIQSPSFTINRLYEARDNLSLSHYDFYRLNEAGIMSSELQETIGDPNIVTIIEWSDVVDDILPKDRLTIYIEADSEMTRKLNIKSGGIVSEKIIKSLSL